MVFLWFNNTFSVTQDAAQAMRNLPEVLLEGNYAIMENSTARPAVGSDITTLYTRFGQPGDAAHYQEIVRDQAALHAALRWPLLAEMQGVPVAAAPSDSPDTTL
jgi:hypothetical protein